MKTRYWTLFLAIVAFALFYTLEALHAADTSAGPDGKEMPDRSAIFKIETLSCRSCEAKIRAALKKDPGVSSVSADLENRTLSVDYAKALTDETKLEREIGEAGYPAKFVKFGQSGSGTPEKPARSGGCGMGCCGSGPG